MTKAIFGKKIGMTQVFNDDGDWVPVTVVQAEQCIVVRKRTQENDGYEALQVGFGDVRRSRVTKPYAGQFRDARMQPTRRLRELRLADCSKYDVGAELGVDQFAPGESVEVTGTSKGKGFQGTVKRHGFTKGPMSHGSHQHRRPASAGATDPARTFKGKKNPGRMGGDIVTVRGLRVEKVLPDKSLLLIRGGIPGANGSVIEVKSRSDGSGG